MSVRESNPPSGIPLNSVHLQRGGAFLIAGIVSGAFGAHAMEAVLDADGLDAFETASRYLLFMGAAILGATATRNEAGLGWVEWGTLLFSGSIFLLLLLKNMGWPVALLGPVTPIGGALMIGGWVLWLRSLRSGEGG